MDTLTVGGITSVFVEEQAASTPSVTAATALAMDLVIQPPQQVPSALVGAARIPSFRRRSQNREVTSVDEPFAWVAASR
jgi:hypothetical protein